LGTWLLLTLVAPLLQALLLLPLRLELGWRPELTLLLLAPLVALALAMADSCVMSAAVHVASACHAKRSTCNGTAEQLSICTRSRQSKHAAGCHCCISKKHDTGTQCCGVQ
jgi:hypothetical protein